MLEIEVKLVEGVEVTVVEEESENTVLRVVVLGVTENPEIIFSL